MAVGWGDGLGQFFSSLRGPVFGAGFKKPGLDTAAHPNLISLDGESVYFFGLGEREAARLLDGITVLNGRKSWLAYILQDIFYDERFAAGLYEKIYDALDSGALPGPAGLDRESVFRWLEDAAPQVEKLVEELAGPRGRREWFRQGKYL